MKKKNFILFSLSLIIASCDAMRNPLPVVTQVEATVIPSLTPFVATPTIASDFDCKNLSPGVVEQQGYILTAINGQYQLINIEDHLDKVFLDFIYRIAISPESDKVAYIKNDSINQMMVISSQTSITLPIEKELNWLSRWLNNDTVILSEGPNVKNSIKLMNVLTGETQLLTPALFTANFYNLSPNETWGGDGLFVISPTKKYAVYPQMSSSSAGLTLIDLLTKDVITSVSPFSISFRPEWSPSGESFIVSEPSNVNENGKQEKNELIRVWTTGDMNILTNISEKNPKAIINSYRWSPNERYVAFWVNLDAEKDSKNSYLAFLDVETNNTVITCLKSEISIFDENLPIWSPTGNQLVIKVFSIEKNVNQIISVDIKNFTYEMIDIISDETPIGWVSFNIFTK